MDIAVFKSVGKAYVQHQFTVPWLDLVDVLTAHHPAEHKTDVMMFNLAALKSADDPTCEPGRRYHGELVAGVWQRVIEGTYDIIPNTVRRCKANVVSISGIILDVDDELSIDQAIKKYADYEFVLYTTFRHTPEHNKFRIVIPFSQPLKALDIQGRQASITEQFPGVDNCSFTVSQSFYFHSGDVCPQTHYNAGHMVDPYADFEYREQPVYIPRSISTDSYEVNDRYQQAVKSALLTCHGLHYAGKGASNQAVLTLINICRSIGMDFAEFDSVCNQIADPASALKDPSVRRQVWTGWSGNTVRRETRDTWISAYNGKPVNSFYQRTDPLQGLRPKTQLEIMMERIKR